MQSNILIITGKIVENFRAQCGVGCIYVRHIFTKPFSDVNKQLDNFARGFVWV